jgi:hypothetical protein
MALISGPDLVREAGITDRQLNYWVKHGLVHAERRTKETQGVPRFYSIGTAHIVKTMAPLVRAGLTPVAARSMTEALLKTGEYDMGHGVTLRLTRMS